MNCLSESIYCIYVLHFKQKFMKKEVKIILYCVVAIAAITVIFLMLWFPKNRIWEPDILPEIPTWDEIFEINAQNSDSQPTKELDHEQEILNDLESLFRSNNGYENIEWDFGFIAPEN